MRIRPSFYPVVLLLLASIALTLSACSRATPDPETAPPGQVQDGPPTDRPADSSEAQLIPTTSAPSGGATGSSGAAPVGSTGTASSAASSPPAGSSGGGGSTGQPASTSQAPTSAPVVPTATPGGNVPGGGAIPGKPPISTPLPPTPTQGPAQPVAVPDTSGPQSQLSDYELAAQASKAATYTGKRCRIDVTNAACNCPTETARSEFIFPSTNDLTWLNELTSGLKTFNLSRLGVNTWTTSYGSEIGPVQIVLIFLQNGYQYTSSTTLADGRTVTCPSIWTR